jgi:hypothetical protein
MFPPLNFPAFEFRMREERGKPQVFDVLRKKFVALTPEEWVRQHTVHFLISLGYPATLMAIETGVKFNQLSKRTDLLVYSHAAQPFLLVECKAPSVAISDATLRQAGVYNSVLKAHYLLITNGITHFCLKQNADGSYETRTQIPAFGT